jgi:hypothetical protein
MRRLVARSGLVRCLGFALLAGCGTEEGPAGPVSALEGALARAKPVSFSAESQSTWPAPVPLRGLTDHVIEVTFEATLTREVTHKLSITRRIERRGRRFHGLETRTHIAPSASNPATAMTHGESLEAIFDGERLAVRRGEGPFIERDARDGLPARILTQLHDLAPFLIRSLAKDLRLEPLAAYDDTTPPEVVGLPVDWRRVVFLNGAGPHLEASAIADLRTLEPRLHEWFGASVDITRGGGRAAFVKPRDANETAELADAAGRPMPEAVLLVDLTFEGTARLEGGLGTIAVKFVQSVSPLGEASFELPADRLPEVRERPWKMIEDVLGDALLPPYRVR